jgi:uncharacterized protein DUF5985
MMLGPIAYTLCALTALACAVLLLRAYRQHGSRLLLWSGLCFACLCANNVLVAIDLVVFPEISLFPIRNGVALIGMLLLLYGLIWESE